MKFRGFSLKSHNWNLTKEKYWTDKLREWKKACTNRYRIAAAASSSNYPAARLLVNKCVYFMTNWGLSICIGLQSTFVLVIQICMLYPVWGLRALMKRPCCRVPTTPAVAISQIEDLSGYVLQLDDEMKASPEVVEQISRSMKFRIESAKDKENNKVFNNNLLELLAAKRPDDDGFKGVEIFDDDDDQIKLSSSWSVPVITLASIAISSVPGIAKDQVQSLIQAIDEALLCIHPVEESFDRANEFVNIRKAATTLWVDAKATTTGAHTIDFPNDDQSSSSSSAAGLLMRRIKRSISSKYPEEIQTNERFFRLLRSMIADVLVACFSNLPRVVMMKCHANEIEKREASVEAAVKLLVQSTKIIEKLEECQLPAGLDPDKMASIEEWIIHLKQP
uniref:uncharacterized protein LOC122580243 n=1 Tax=Erigeron canadensis TaxID=72917 RepID=UPI001CB91F72|nr:uncharacterized protein LOC122580243 [Erigeron canadensis]